MENISGDLSAPSPPPPRRLLFAGAYVCRRRLVTNFVCVQREMAEEEDPYAVSSDSEDEDSRKPPPKIQIEGRANADINQLDVYRISVVSVLERSSPIIGKIRRYGLSADTTYEL
ncbi:hypothetical protein Q1695_007172 [Nippostrongylus brasiliensis]|nr:hypothetical protein Q1695_007172 [Nippostrongylus brasiliensis]